VGENNIPDSNIEAETSTAPVLLKKSDIPQASLAERTSAEFGKANVFCGDF